MRLSWAKGEYNMDKIIIKKPVFAHPDEFIGYVVENFSISGLAQVLNKDYAQAMSSDNLEVYFSPEYAIIRLMDRMFEGCEVWYETHTWVCFVTTGMLGDMGATYPGVDIQKLVHQICGEQQMSIGYLDHPLPGGKNNVVGLGSYYWQHIAGDHQIHPLGSWYSIR